MQRARPFRLTLARLGILLLAWHALVLQALLAGPLAAAAPAGHPAELCLGSADAAPGDSGTPLHTGANCVCIVHCGGTSAAPPPVQPHFATVRHATAMEFANLRAARAALTLRLDAVARGPPARASVSF